LLSELFIRTATLPNAQNNVRGENTMNRNGKGGTAMQETEPQLKKPSYWQLIFLQSKVNGAPYKGEVLPGQSWDWPKDTYFRRRLNLIKILGLTIPPNVLARADKVIK
jgi:hypothetical protein